MAAGRLGEIPTTVSAALPETLSYKMTVLNALPIAPYAGDGAGLPAMEIIHRFGTLYGAIHPPSRTRPIGAGPMFELKHPCECTYAPGCKARLAHLLQTLRST